MAALTALHSYPLPLEPSRQPALWDGCHGRGGLRVLGVLSVLAGSLLGCSSDTAPGTAPRSAAQTYWALQLNQHAINLATVAPYDTVQLHATPLTAAGTPLAGAGPVTYRVVSDSTVTVTAAGVVTARFVSQGTPTLVVASLTTQGMTLTDTALVQVTDTVPQHALATFTLQPTSGDSAKRAVDVLEQQPQAWPVRATDAGGTPVCSSTPCPLLVYYTSSNPAVATIDRNTAIITPVDTGRTVFTATTWAYGVPKRDSVVFTVGYALSYFLNVWADGFHAAPVITLGVGADVTFRNVISCLQACAVTVPRQDSVVDVVFDHPPVVPDTGSCLFNGYPFCAPSGTGNITLSGVFVSAARRFPVAGRYRYHSPQVPADTLTLDIRAGAPQ